MNCYCWERWLGSNRSLGLRRPLLVTASRVARIAAILETQKKLRCSTKAVRESWAGRQRPGLTRSSESTSLNSEVFLLEASKILASRKDVFASFIMPCRFRRSLFMICLLIVSLVIFQHLSSLRTFLLAQWISLLSHVFSGRTVKLLLLSGACEFRTLAKPEMYCSRAVSQSTAGKVRSGSVDRSIG